MLEQEKKIKHVNCQCLVDFANKVPILSPIARVVMYCNKHWCENCDFARIYKKKEKRTHLENNILKGEGGIKPQEEYTRLLKRCYLSCPLYASGNGPNLERRSEAALPGRVVTGY